MCGVYMQSACSVYVCVVYMCNVCMCRVCGVWCVYICVCGVWCVCVMGE